MAHGGVLKAPLGYGAVGYGAVGYGAVGYGAVGYGPKGRARGARGSEPSVSLGGRRGVLASGPAGYSCTGPESANGLFLHDPRSMALG